MLLLVLLVRQDLDQLRALLDESPHIIAADFTWHVVVVAPVGSARRACKFPARSLRACLLAGGMRPRRAACRQVDYRSHAGTGILDEPGTEQSSLSTSCKGGR